MQKFIQDFKGATCRSKFVHPEKLTIIFSSWLFVIFKSQSSTSSTIIVPLWFIIMSFFFFCLSEMLFSCFLQFKAGELIL